MGTFFKFFFATQYFQIQKEQNETPWEKKSHVIANILRHKTLYLCWWLTRTGLLQPKYLLQVFNVASQMTNVHPHNQSTKALCLLQKKTKLPSKSWACDCFSCRWCDKVQDHSSAELVPRATVALRDTFICMSTLISERLPRTCL